MPLRLIFGVGILLFRCVLFVRSFVPASLILLLCALMAMIGFSLRWLDGVGSWIMLAAALALMFAAGTFYAKR